MRTIMHDDERAHEQPRARKHEQRRHPRGNIEEVEHRPEQGGQWNQRVDDLPYRATDIRPGIRGNDRGPLGASDLQRAGLEQLSHAGRHLETGAGGRSSGAS